MGNIRLVVKGNTLWLFVNRLAAIYKNAYRSIDDMNFILVPIDMSK